MQTPDTLLLDLDLGIWREILATDLESASCARSERPAAGQRRRRCGAHGVVSPVVGAYRGRSAQRQRAMSTRDDVLGRVRQALADVQPDEPGSVPHEQVPGQRVDDLMGLFADRVADYRAGVIRCDVGAVASAIADVLPKGSRVVIPDGLPANLLAEGLVVVRDDPASPLTNEALDQLDAVLTTCAVGIATTGTVILDHGPGQGRRALTLVPDVHICVIRSDQIVADVPDAITRLDPTRVQTWISGPSATSDIELTRVEGVHGPRHLHVVVVNARG